MGLGLEGNNGRALFFPLPFQMEGPARAETGRGKWMWPTQLKSKGFIG
jgi:hypothetical protein